MNQYETAAGAAILHDDSGNLDEDHRGQTYGHDASNRLRHVWDAFSTKIDFYVYSSEGNVRYHTESGTTERLYHSGTQEIVAYDKNNTDVNQRYVRLPGSVDEPLLMVDFKGACSGGGCERWLHADARGTIVAAADETGAMEDIYTYTEYGAPVEPGGVPFRYTGQKYGQTTGLYHYKARFYDPDTGRFLQTDPIRYADGMNMYAYVQNDPVNKTDPSGLAWHGMSLSWGCAAGCFDDNGDWNSSIPYDVSLGGIDSGGGRIWTGRYVPRRRNSNTQGCISGCADVAGSNSSPGSTSGFVHGSSSGVDYGDVIIVIGTRAAGSISFGGSEHFFYIGGGGSPSVFGRFGSERAARDNAAGAIAAAEDPGRRRNDDLYAQSSTVARYTSFVVRRGGERFGRTRAVLTGVTPDIPPNAVTIVMGPGRYDVNRQQVNSSDYDLLGRTSFPYGYLVIYNFDQFGNYLNSYSTRRFWNRRG